MSDSSTSNGNGAPTASDRPGMLRSFPTRSYQQEMLEESLRNNIIVALDTGSGKTWIAILRMKHEVEREPKKVSWFVAPTVTLCEQQHLVIKMTVPCSVGVISGALQPDQWKNASLWRKVLADHKIIVSTPQVLLDALRHAYVDLGRDISLLIFDEAHHAVDKHPYNRIMVEFYSKLPPRQDRLDGDAVTHEPREERPAVLGLTASPIFGGNVAKAFQTIESNLDCIIRAPSLHREELLQYVHRPKFEHVMYNGVNLYDPPFSTNLASLEAVRKTLNIEDDPYVKSLRKQLAGVVSDMRDQKVRLDQKLSKAIYKEDTFTHKGLRDFASSAEVIQNEIGVWAADWYVWNVMERAKDMDNPYHIIFSSWQNREKAYLSSILKRVVVSPVSFVPEDVIDDCSDQVRVLVQRLLTEKEETEARNEAYSCIIFVQRRDAVIALAAVLRYHPQTCDQFRVGCLLGFSDNYQRHSFLDITRTLLKDTQEKTLNDFRIGEKNVLVSTSVAEEGIDVQACGSVIRWDPPPNMASWAQSRGRARRKQSTFTLMFENGGVHQRAVADWEKLEREMVALYQSNRQRLQHLSDAAEVDVDADDDEDEDEEFRVPATGALLTLHSAVSHLEHFCSVLPNSGHVDCRPLFDIDPPDLPEGWHSLENRSVLPIRPHQGPFGSKVTLPRTVPPHLRVFEVKRQFRTKISAHRHAAFKAYKALYDAGMLNDSLLPLTSAVQPELEGEVKDLLRQVEKRAGMARVSVQMDPWLPRPQDEAANVWFAYELTVDGLDPLQIFTRSRPVSWFEDEIPILYRRGHSPAGFNIRARGMVDDGDDIIRDARYYTRRMFWAINGSRMKWDNVDFSYLFLPSDDVDDNTWEARRHWLAEQVDSASEIEELSAQAEDFGDEFEYPDDLMLIRAGYHFAKAFKFVSWRFEELDEEEEAELRERYNRFDNIDISSPLLVVERIPPRTNFLLPLPSKVDTDDKQKTFCLLPSASTVTLLSPYDLTYSTLLPSILRAIAISTTVNSLRTTLFGDSSLSDIPTRLLQTALTAPVSQEQPNYQRLETLGDTVLKLVAGIELLAQYPLWHEGYLTKKREHAISNVRLAKDAVRLELYRWIIRDRLTGKKWLPEYFNVKKEKAKEMEKKLLEPKPEPPPPVSDETTDGDKAKKKRRRAQKSQADGIHQLSTKVLADVVEALVGAAYLHGSFPMALECVNLFSLGITWNPIQSCISTMLSRVETTPPDLPPHLAIVERMLGYTFQHKLLLLEALTHASYQESTLTVSYERMEFLGDSVLDMIVTEYLYTAPGKEYSPGHMFLRKCAVVNAHLLAYICLNTSAELDPEMPRPIVDPNADTSSGNNGGSNIQLVKDLQRVFLWQCLLHSSPRVLDDQLTTSARYERSQPALATALASSPLYPWAALLRLQAPKFFSDMLESIIGAIYLDSEASIPAVRSVLDTLGFMAILERIVKHDVDVLHPISRLSLWAAKKGAELEYVYTKEKGNIACSIVVDGEEVAREEGRFFGKASKDEVRFLAAEKAIEKFKLWDDEGVAYANSKGKGKQKATE